MVEMLIKWERGSLPGSSDSHFIRENAGTHIYFFSLDEHLTGIWHSPYPISRQCKSVTGTTNLDLILITDTPLHNHVVDLAVRAVGANVPHSSGVHILQHPLKELSFANPLTFDVARDGKTCPNDAVQCVGLILEKQNAGFFVPTILVAIYAEYPCSRRGDNRFMCLRQLPAEIPEECTPFLGRLRGTIGENLRVIVMVAEERVILSC
jgi:hypothetical protein